MCLIQNTIKPEIVFFGENLPARFFTLQQEDVLNADLMIVLGTSLEVSRPTAIEACNVFALQVFPFAGLIDRVSTSIPRLLINRFATGAFARSRSTCDFVFEGAILFLAGGDCRRHGGRRAPTG
jgi:hypothetical protein